jgi:hypothetical protein
MELKTWAWCFEIHEWSMAIYGSEAWGISEVLLRRIEAYEYWCWKQMLRIKSTDKV